MRPIHPSPVVLAVACAGILFALPVVIRGLPVLGDDADVTVVRAALFSGQIWSGEAYPRWLGGMNAGLGSPTFYFYPPAPYYAAAFVRPLLPRDPDGWRQAGLAAALAIVASGIFAYLWLRGTARAAAALAAVLYMAAPYHLAVDLYARAALAELWGFAWMPLILHGARGLAAGRRFAFPIMALGVALLVMSHPPTALLFLPVAALQAGFAVEKGRRLRSAALALGAILLGGGLSAAYWLPAAALQRYASLQGIGSGRLSYASRFLFAGLPGWGDFDAKVTWITLDALLLACGAAYVAARREAASARPGPPARRDERRLWMAVALCATFMTTPLSAPLWRAIPLLPRVQFPFRFNLLLTVAMAALLAACLEALPRDTSGSLRLVLGMMIVAVAAWAPITARAAGRSYPGPGADPDRLSRIRHRLAQRIDADELRPPGTISLQSGDLDDLTGPMGVTQGGPPAAIVLEGSGRLRVRREAPGDLLIEVESKSGVRVGVRRLDWPGWSARLVEEDRRLVVVPATPRGLVAVAVPPGRHDVEFRLEPVGPERLGLALSAAAAGAWALLLFGLSRGWRRSGPRAVRSAGAAARA